MPAQKRASPVKKAAGNNGTAKSENKLARLGLRTDIDLALHLPTRYEDETQILSIAQAGMRGMQTVQVEGVVSLSDIQFRPRRQLVVTIGDGSGQLVLRFLNFYGSQATQLAAGARIRARGELRHGFFGAEMVHPSYKVVLEDAPLPTASTPRPRFCPAMALPRPLRNLSTSTSLQCRLRLASSAIASKRPMLSRA